MSSDLAGGRATDPAFFVLLTGSFARLVGRPLVPQSADAAWLYADAPFAVVAHDTNADPKFVYANRAAQACFEYAWDEFIGMPSRLSAEAPERAERQALLDQVSRHGFLSGYRGVRVAKSGRRFLIEDGVVWELIDESGIRHGQAATFSSWRDVQPASDARRSRP
jgi:MEKHLA domain